MGTLKFGLEKPTFIWILISVLYIAVYWAGPLKHAPPTAVEQAHQDVIRQFAESSFPPKIGLIRELPALGHLGFYALFGRAYHAVKGELSELRAINLALMLFAFLVFVRLGYRFTYRNRLSPLWISVALLVLAANPYAWGTAFALDWLPLLLVLMLVAMYLFEIDQVGWSSLFSSAAILVDWRAALLAFVLTRVTGEQSRLLRPERMAAFLLPFVIGALPLIAWEGVVPQGAAHDWLHGFREKESLFRLEGLFYALALLPLYSLLFTWAWGFRARTRALSVGAVAAAVMIPLYFIFPVRPDRWEEVRSGAELPLGLVDQGAIALAGPYKNLLLFLPWLAGTFLFMQLLLMDVLDRSRWLRYFIIFFLAIQPFAFDAGDHQFLIVLPAVLLLSLSEALVGEEGKLA